MRRTEAGLQLHDTYPLYTPKAALYKRELLETLTLIRSAGIEPNVLKNWSTLSLPLPATILS